MVTLTDGARQRIEELKRNAKDKEIAIRIVPSDTKPGQLDVVWDKEKEGDEVVKGEDGNNLLIVERDLAATLKGMVMDYTDAPQGKGFIITRPPSSEGSP